MFGAIAGGIASALAGGAMSKLFGGGQKAGSGGIQGDVLATDKKTVGMGDAGIKSAIQGSNVPNPDEAVPSFVSGAMAKAGKGLLEGTLQAGTSAVSDKLRDLVGLGGKSAAEYFFFQGEDGIRDVAVTGVQTCALPISKTIQNLIVSGGGGRSFGRRSAGAAAPKVPPTTVTVTLPSGQTITGDLDHISAFVVALRDRKSTRLNSSHGYISYAVFCLKKKTKRD